MYEVEAVMTGELGMTTAGPVSALSLSGTGGGAARSEGESMLCRVIEDLGCKVGVS
jgi:hypothetical protein